MLGLIGIVLLTTVFVASPIAVLAWRALMGSTDRLGEQAEAEEEGDPFAARAEIIEEQDERSRVG